MVQTSVPWLNPDTRIRSATDAGLAIFKISRVIFVPNSGIPSAPVESFKIGLLLTFSRQWSKLNSDKTLGSLLGISSGFTFVIS
ncbi:Uncharacterised protein [Mycoplasmoides gallisepticum]|uniref:Uncharacterized protein n=1 Tax=Mycoplasmoides gallisepticum TaxID=2096 RepID=A0A3B0PWX5_MYCGL|nr:Uncharacterised protein [Mycoplasmoides gallisepticum]